MFLPRMFVNPSVTVPYVIRSNNRCNPLDTLRNLGAYAADTLITDIQSVDIWGKDLDFVVSDCKRARGDIWPGPRVAEHFSRNRKSDEVRDYPRNMPSALFAYQPLTEGFEPPEWLAFHDWTTRFDHLSPDRITTGLRIAGVRTEITRELETKSSLTLADV